MKPIFLCICDKYDNELEKYTHINLLTCENIGVSKEFTSPKNLLNINFNKEENELTKILDKVIKNKSKIHIVGDTSKDIDNLNLLISFFDSKKFKKLNLHLVGEYDKKAILVDSYDYDKLFPKRIKFDKNDYIIFFNMDITCFKSIISKLKKQANVLSLISDNGIFKLPKFDSLGSIVDDNILKCLRCNIDNYSFDGYKNIKYKYLKNIEGNIFNERLTDYDLIIANVPSKDFAETFDYIKDRTIFLIITKIGRRKVLVTNEHGLVSDANGTDIMPTILELLGIKVKEKTLFIKENKYLCIFEVISILFILSSLVYYLARLLHFYLIK